MHKAHDPKSCVYTNFTTWAVVSIFKVQVECLDPHERISKLETRRCETNRTSLNHLYSIAFLGVPVKGGKPAIRVGIPSGEFYTTHEIVVSFLPKISRNYSFLKSHKLEECSILLERAYQTDLVSPIILKIFKSGPSIFGPNNCLNHICSSFHFGRSTSGVHMCAPTRTIFPNKHPVPFLFSLAPPNLAT